MKKNVFYSLILRILYSPIGNRIVSLLGGQKLYAKYRVWKRKKQRLSYARKEYGKGSSIGSLDDYRKDLKKYWVSYPEYAYMYEFYKKTEEEKSEYLTQLKIMYIYRSFGNGVVLPIVRDKQRFLKTFGRYIHRKWLYVPEATFEEFSKLVSEYDCIVKPCDGARGKGVFKIYKDSDHKDDKELYNRCVKDRNVVEQCIESCKELKSFHPQSLNTIRVVTIAGKEKACVFSGVLRTGVGKSVVDNSHAGGISAQINVKDGIVETDGANSNGEKFVSHPDSGIIFKGYRIPNWDTIVNTCCKLAIELGNPITGWDVVINNEGDLEIIEANYGPDLDMMQVRYGHGLKKELYSMLKEYCGIEMK